MNLPVAAQIFWLAFQIVVAIPALYLLVLTAAAVWKSRSRNIPVTGQHNAKHSFAILIPAHNEEVLLPACLESLSKLVYPADRYEVHVVADNCTDSTALVAASIGAKVHERFNDTERGKPYALRFGLNDLWNSGREFDAVVIVDADTSVSPNFLAVMDQHLAKGERAIQAFYTVRSPERSWSEALRFAALAGVHYLRPLARTALGGSVGLKGNGMVFTTDILKKHPWSTSLTEDIEYHMALVFDGERVTFAPDAVVMGEMPNSLGSSASQHDRWERGRIQAAKTYIPRLLSAALKDPDRSRAFLYTDAAAEHFIPPFSLLALLVGLSLVVSAALFAVAHFFGGNIPLAWVSLGLGVGLMLAQVIYVLTSLKLANAPKAVYRALLYAPALVLWKVGQLGRVALSRGGQQWVRTARN